MDAKDAVQEAIARTIVLVAAGGDASRLMPELYRHRLRPLSKPDWHVPLWFRQYSLATEPWIPPHEESHLQFILSSIKRDLGEDTPVVVVTSPNNHEAIYTYLGVHGMMGLSRIAVIQQEALPVVTLEGELLFWEDGNTLKAPDGTAGCLRALREAEWFARRVDEGYEHVFAWYVNDPVSGRHIAKFMKGYIDSEAPMLWATDSVGRDKLGQIYREVNTEKLTALATELEDAPACYVLRTEAIDELLKLVDMHTILKNVPILLPNGKLLKGVKHEKFLFDAYWKSHPAYNVLAPSKPKSGPVEQPRPIDVKQVPQQAQTIGVKPIKPQPRYQHGDKIGGRYQVHQALMGGMGEVYMCLDLETIHPCALKTFQQRYLTNPKLHAAFENEVSIWVALERHPNIVPCFYMDILDSQPFAVLEWIAGDESRGTDLRSWLRHGPLDLRLALDFTIDICRGLIHAQGKRPGLVHCDLKPENILVAQRRVAKITDFGLARVVHKAELEITAGAGGEIEGRQSLWCHGGIVGTPPYMAPEQWQGETLDARTDIYAIGCLLHELLTGRWPFQASTLEGLRRQHLRADIPKLTDERSMPSSLDSLLAECLAKRREQRFATVDDLLQELSSIYYQHFSEPARAILTSGKFTAIDYSNRGNTYRNLLEHDKALADYDRAIQLDPTDAEAYRGRGIVYYTLQQYKKALDDYNRAIELDPINAQSYTNRGVIYDELQQRGKALADYNEAILLDSTETKAYNNRGLVYADLHRYEEALADLSRAIELDPNYARAYFNRGNIYHGLQRYDEALASYGQAIQLDPGYAKAYYNVGAVFGSLGKWHEALPYLERAAQLGLSDAAQLVVQITQGVGPELQNNSA